MADGDSGERIVPGAAAGAVRVELFGVARLAAATRVVEIPVEGTTTLAEVGAALAARCPALVGNVLSASGTLLDGHVFNLNGRDFVRDAATCVHPGAVVLVIPAAAGG